MSHAVSRFLTFTVSLSLIPVDRLNVGKLDFLSSGDALEVSELFNLAGVDVEARVLKEAGQGFEPGLFARSARILQVMPINFETCKGLKNIFFARYILTRPFHPMGAGGRQGTQTCEKK